MKRALVVLSGTPPPLSAVPDMRGAFVVAADGGANTLAAWGHVPSVLVGDLDSVRADVLAAFRAKGVDVREHPRRKLHTDGFLAVETALAAGVDEVVIVAAMGGRLDQMLGNLHLVRHAADAGVRVRVVDAGGDLWSVTPGQPLDLDLADGTTVSVLPLTERADGVRLDGFEWPLTGAVMRAGDPYGLSNEARAGGQRVACAKGVLAVVVPR